VALDVSDRQVIPQVCTGCGREYSRVVIFVTENGSAVSLVSVVCHGHERDAWLDATFGSWEEPYADHVTFSCRLSPDGAGLVDALVAGKGDARHYGQRLTRQQALAHPLLVQLWPLVDEVALRVPEVRAAVG
jgi:hypothetical protein